jgi:hypothetical protein
MTLQPGLRHWSYAQIWTKKEERHDEDDARSQPVPEPVRANSRGQHDNECSSNEEDRGDFARNNRYNQDYYIKVEISSFGDDIGVEEFLNWFAECDLFYKHSGISNSRMVKITGFILKHEALV